MGVMADGLTERASARRCPGIEVAPECEKEMAAVMWYHRIRHGY